MELDSELFSAQKRNGKRFPICHFLNSGAEGDDAFQLSKKTNVEEVFIFDRAYYIRQQRQSGEINKRSRES
jgi:hypothetical protein